jgi:hypothetical protein
MASPGGPFEISEGKLSQAEDEIKKIALEQARNRAAIEKADAFIRELGRLVAIHTVTTDRLLEDLREAARRR